jgi:hypothetical protein
MAAVPIIYIECKADRRNARYFQLSDAEEKDLGR